MKGQNNLIPVMAVAIGGILVFAAVQNVHPLDLIKNSLSKTTLTLRPISNRTAVGGKTGISQGGKVNPKPGTATDVRK